MSFDFLRCRRYLLLAGVALGAFMSARGQQPPPQSGRAILFSEPGSATAVSNLNETAAQKTPPNALVDQFKKPSEFPSPNDSLDGVLAPPVRPALPPTLSSKKAKELLEKQKDWVFLSPEDYDFGLSAEEIFNIPEYGPDGREKTKGTAQERYIERLYGARAGATNRLRSDGVFGLRNKFSDLDGPGSAATGDAFGGGLSDMEQTLKRLSNPEPDSTLFPDPVATRNVSDFYGPGGVGPNGRTQAQDARLQDFKQLLNSRTLPSPTVGVLDPLSGVAVFSPQPVLPGGSGQSDSMSPLRMSAGPLQRPQGLPDAAARPSYPSLTPVLPATEPPRATAPPPPTFSAPKRQF
jgi:hypothetical protein